MRACGGVSANLASRVASHDATDLRGSSLQCSARICLAQVFLIDSASSHSRPPHQSSCGCKFCRLHFPIPSRCGFAMLVRRKFAIRFAERFQPNMQISRLMGCAAIAGSVAMAAQAGAVGGMSDPFAGADRASIVRIQYGYDRTDGGHSGPGGPGWRGGLPGGWSGRPGWYADPPGTPRHWPSHWGGGWYGGWYQPYWGEGAWASPNWAYGSEHYYGHYPAPSACGPECGHPAREYVPLK